MPAAVQKWDELEQRRENMFVTTPTIMELWSGIAQSSRPEQEKKKVILILESQTILVFDKESAEEAGRIDGTLYKEGIPIEPEDCMIAGIAKHNRKIIVTRNIKHFGRIKDLKLEKY